MSFTDRLSADEFTSFYKEIAETYETVESDIDSVYYQKAINKVNGSVAELNLLKSKDRGHYLTFDINEIHEARVGAVRSILGERKTKANHTDYDVRDAIIKVSFWLKKHVGRLTNVSQDALTARIDQLLDDLETNEKILDDVKTLGWLSLFQGLAELNDEYRKARFDRRDAESDRRIALKGANEARRKLYNRLTVLLDMTCSIVNTEGIEVAEKLMAMLESSFKRMEAIAKSRITSGSDGNAKDDNVDDAIDGELNKSSGESNS